MSVLVESEAYGAVSGAGGGTPLSPTPASYQSAFATNAMGCLGRLGMCNRQTDSSIQFFQIHIPARIYQNAACALLARYPPFPPTRSCLLREAS